MRIRIILFITYTLLALSNAAHADAPLKSSLGLDVEQARQVQEIQKAYRRPFAAKRQEYNRQSRKLRRARSDNDLQLIEQQELVVAALREDLRQIRAAENADIRGVLDLEQRAKFEEVLQQRNAMVGSSRDAKLLKP